MNGGAGRKIHAGYKKTAFVDRLSSPLISFLLRRIIVHGNRLSSASLYTENGLWTDWWHTQWVADWVSSSAAADCADDRVEMGKNRYCWGSIPFGF